MQNPLIIKLAIGEEVTDKDIEIDLEEICEIVHSSCDSACPIYAINGGKAPIDDKNSRFGCDCFRNGEKMLQFIRHRFDPDSKKPVEFINVEITKLIELKYAKNPGNTEEGYQTIEKIIKKDFKSPQIGHRFNVGNFSSSCVVELPSENTFKTLNSIYKWEIVS